VSHSGAIDVGVDIIASAGDAARLARQRETIVVAYIVVAVLAMAVAVFTMQNTTSVAVRFLFWQIEEVPLAAVILAALVTGFVLVGVPLGLSRWRLKRRLRDLQRGLPAAIDRSGTGTA
jgi:uncharacterized integral membrane protein